MQDPVDQDKASNVGWYTTGEEYRINGHGYQHAIEMHSGCDNEDGGNFWMDFDLAQQWTMLHTAVGISDDSSANGSASYQVIDMSGHRLLARGTLRFGGKAPQLNLVVSHVLRLRLLMNVPLTTQHDACWRRSAPTNVVWGDPTVTA